MENTSIITEILIPGKSVQIEIINNSGNKIITKTTVCKLEENSLILNLPNRSDIFNHVHANTNIAIVCKNNEEPQEYVFFTQFVKVLGTDPPGIILKRPMEFRKGRHAIRFEVAIPFSYFIDNKEIKGGSVVNLSITGLLAIIQSYDLVDEGQEIAFKLFLPTLANPLLMTGKVVRIIKQENQYKMALNFPYILPDLQDQITKYLFNCQRKAVKQGQQQKEAFIKIE